MAKVQIFLPSDILFRVPRLNRISAIDEFDLAAFAIRYHRFDNLIE